MKKAKEILEELGPAPAKGEAWMARREVPGQQGLEGSPKSRQQSQSNGGSTLDGGAASSIASTASNTSSMGLGVSISSNGGGSGGGGRSFSSASLSSLAGSVGPSPRNGSFASSFVFSEPPTPTSERGGSLWSSGGSPRNNSKASPEEEAQRRLVKCMRRMRDMLYGDGTDEPCAKKSKVRGTELWLDTLGGGRTTT